MPTDPMVRVVSGTNLDLPRWSRKGERLAALEWPRGALVTVAVGDGRVFDASAPEPAVPLDQLQAEGSARPCEITPDGKAFLVCDRPFESNPERLILIRNTFTLLNERIGN